MRDECSVGCLLLNTLECELERDVNQNKGKTVCDRQSDGKVRVAKNI